MPSSSGFGNEALKAWVNKQIENAFAQHGGGY